MSKSPKFIVTIGTSTGGIRAVEDLVKQLTPDMDAAFFIVHHLSRKGVGDVLFYRLQHLSPLPCKLAEDDQPIERGVVYVAPPDVHLIFSENTILLRKSARENRWRPSINNMMRSAAANFNSKVIGIILTGLLDDGASGMACVKRSGGITIVQDPNEAEHPDMPLSVIQHIEVTHIESLQKMGQLLSKIIATTEPKEARVPYDVLVEARMDQRVATRIDELGQFEKSEFGCPDCGGVMYVTQKDHPTHFRCNVGHSATERELSIRYAEALETNMWTSIRMMEEQRTLFLRLHKRDKERGFESVSNQHLEKAKQMELQIERVKEIIAIATDVEYA